MLSNNNKTKQNKFSLVTKRSGDVTFSATWDGL